MSIVATNEVGVNIGLREFRGQLSSYVDEVKLGRTFTLTEHGKPVARLVPLAGQSTYDQLVAQGIIQVAERQTVSPVRQIETDGTVSDLVAEQRR